MCLMKSYYGISLLKQVVVLFEGCGLHATKDGTFNHFDTTCLIIIISNKINKYINK